MARGCRYSLAAVFRRSCSTPAAFKREPVCDNGIGIIVCYNENVGNINSVRRYTRLIIVSRMPAASVSVTIEYSLILAARWHDAITVGCRSHVSIINTARICRPWSGHVIVTALRYVTYTHAAACGAACPCSCPASLPSRDSAASWCHQDWLSTHLLSILNTVHVMIDLRFITVQMETHSEHFLYFSFNF